LEAAAIAAGAGPAAGIGDEMTDFAGFAIAAAIGLAARRCGG
jgi:hypothetical protein